MKRFYGLVAMGLIVGLTSGASAHIGERIYLIFELSEDDLADIDLRDASIADWEDVVGDAQLVTTDFFQDPTVGDGAQYDPADLDYRIWLGWNGNLGTIWMGMERIDNVYINEYAGGDLGSLWRHDGVEFMLDGDHTGGDYAGSADENWTDEEKDLNNNRTAQQYVAIGDTPDGRHVGYLGRAEWVNALPYADGGGGSTGDGPTTTIIEFFVTPFDDLIWNSPDDSVASPLFDGKIIGFQISAQDMDEGPSDYRAFHTLSGQAATWRFAERFVDGRLVSAGGDAGTVADDDSDGEVADDDSDGEIADDESDGEVADDESSGEDQQEPEGQPTTAVEFDGISSSHDSVREDDGSVTITLTVTLDKAAGTGGETVALAIVSPTIGKRAKRGEDFDATLDETITIPTGRRVGTAQLILTPKDNTTADGDKALAVDATSSSGHRALINIKIIDDEIADGEEDDGQKGDEMAFGFAGKIEDQAYTAGAAISALVLPEATGGEGEVTHRVSGLPAGLAFDAATRTISGTPEAATDGAVEIAYTAEDSAGEVATLTFFITVNPALSFGDLFDLLGAGEE